ncbi:hypothetical protein Airi02_017340 [Actinoallomurus iriomotensis]|uniref:Uncharacterized protein n=1 Tax=Actinoallomurus iriomotensis TaxID=478107 RepID=A0A9W6RXD7_9ACTN|nr:hypothetical protein Airi02_017340 [Actinoallomurus iriomotensis]
MLEGRTGQSPGRRRLRITLADAHAGRPTCWTGCRATSAFWPLWDAERRTFADKLPHTIVLGRPGHGGLAPPSPDVPAAWERPRPSRSVLLEPNLRGVSREQP